MNAVINQCCPNCCPAHCSLQWWPWRDPWQLATNSMVAVIGTSLSSAKIFAGFLWRITGRKKYFQRNFGTSSIYESAGLRGNWIEKNWYFFRHAGYLAKIFSVTFVVISYIESKDHGKILKIEVLLPFMPIQPNYHFRQTQTHATVILISVFSKQHVYLF
jgi:hypothetical protein